MLTIVGWWRGGGGRVRDVFESLKNCYYTRKSTKSCEVLEKLSGNSTAYVIKFEVAMVYTSLGTAILRVIFIDLWRGAITRYAAHVDSYAGRL